MANKYENFGKYILLEKLATGGMAEVYLAKLTGATGIAKFVAMKRILPQYFDNPEFIEMFKEEAKIAVNLSHSNVVSIFDFGVEKKQFYLVMEFVEGRNLRQVLNHMKKNSVTFSIDQIAYIIKEVAAGLDHAHRCLDGTTGRPLNITHRDISPQNVMVSFEGEIKVVDFGIAKAESQLENTRAGTIKGKFSYMSPEQSEGMPVDLRTDVFSLGIVLWELLANDRLFLGNNEIAILKKIRNCQVPDLEKINPNVPQELARICKKALARDRNMRYQTASALHKDLNRFLNTHFPDFSSQDFSIFMKTLYSDVVLDNRKKFIEFSQLANSEEEQSEVTEVSVTKNDDKLELPSGHPASKVNLEGLHERGVYPEHSQEYSLSQARNNRTQSNTKVRQNPYRPTKGKQKSGSLIINLFLVAGFLLLSVGIWDQLVQRDMLPASVKNMVPASIQSLLRPKENTQRSEASQQPVETVKLPNRPLDSNSSIANNPEPIIEEIPPPTKAIERPSPPPPPSAHQPGPLEPVTSAGVHVVHIQSEPSLAKIWIDGVDTGLITPGRIRVKANTPFTLGLTRDNYLEYEHRFITRNDTSFKATLQRALQGYIDLSVSNAGVNSVVSINGKKLSEALPLERYSVPAEVDLVIRVENPYTRTAAQETVRLKDSERKKVHLILQ